MCRAANRDRPVRLPFFFLAYHWPVISQRLQTLLIWLVLSAQAIASVAGPVGLLVCRSPDGSTHIEWASRTCNDATANLASHEDDSIHHPCSEGMCVDQPITLDPALPIFKNRMQRLVAGASMPVELPRAMIEAVSPTVTALIDRPAVADGPPEQFRRLLGVVVLVV